MPASLGAERQLRRDEQALIRACLSGDAGAWDELVERFGRLVYSIPRKLGLSDADADDVFQTVFGIALRRLETLRDCERVSAWLIRTTYREAWRIGRGRKLAGAPVPAELPSDEAPQDQFVEALERQQIVREALEAIDERCRQLLQALFFEQPTPDYAAIAARFGMPVGSIGPTRARCFSKLETILRGRGL